MLLIIKKKKNQENLNVSKIPYRTCCIHGPNH